MSQSPGAWMWKAFLRKQGRAGKHTAHPESAPEKPCKYRRFPGLFFHALPPFAAHIRPLLLPQGSPGADRGAVPLPPIREESPAAYRARPGFCDTLHGQRPFQHRIKGQHRRAEGNKRPSSICPAYSRDSPAASSHSLYHSWRTTLSPACGSPPFPAGSIHGSCLPPVLGLSCSR